MKKLLILSVFSGGLLAPAQTVIIRAGTVLDGKGGVLRNTEVAVQNGKIMKVGSSLGKPAYDMRTRRFCRG